MRLVWATFAQDAIALPRMGKSITEFRGLPQALVARFG